MAGPEAAPDWIMNLDSEIESQDGFGKGYMACVRHVLFFIHRARQATDDLPYDSSDTAHAALLQLIMDCEAVALACDSERRRILGDTVPPGYWDRAREHLASLPDLPEEQDDDLEPLL